MNYKNYLFVRSRNGIIVYLELKKNLKMKSDLFANLNRKFKKNKKFKDTNNIKLRNGLLLKNSARFMVTDSKEFPSIDPKNVEKVIKDRDTTLTFEKPLGIEIEKSDTQILSTIGEKIADGKELINFPELESWVQKFDNPTFRGIMGITWSLTAASETPYQVSRLIERIRISRVVDVITEQRQRGDGKRINKWIPDPNKLLGDVNPRFQFLSTERIVTELSNTPYAKAPHFLIEESPIVKTLASQAAVTRTLAVAGVTCGFFRLALCGEIFQGNFKQLPKIPTSLIETNKTQLPSVMGIDTEVVSEIKKKECLEKTKITPKLTLPAPDYDFEFKPEESGSTKEEEHFSLSEVDSNLVSDSTEVKLKRQLEGQQVPSEIQYSESLNQSASDDSSISFSSPSRGKRSNKSDD
jgi:hypothetical protein